MKPKAWTRIYAAALILGAALASGCTQAGPPSGPSGTAPAPLPSEQETPSAPKPLPGGQKVPLTVFFSMETTGIKDGQEVAGEKLVAVKRLVPSGTYLIADAAQLWLDGPTAAERARGLALAAPAGLKVRSVKLGADGVLTVDLPKAAAPAGGTAATMNTLGQLVYTMTAQPGVRAVDIAVDGKSVTSFGGEGFVIAHPLTRADFADYFLR